jgi:Glycosyltransferase family 87
MRQDGTPVDGPAAMASGPVASAGAAQAEASVALPRVGTLDLRRVLPRLRLRLGPTAGSLALAALTLAALAVVVFATAGPNALVPRADLGFPNWEAGPLHGLFGRLVSNPTTIGIGLSAVLVGMLVAYLVALGAVRALSIRAIAIFVIAVHAILLLGPPLQLTDLFNYLGYARLGGLHHLNPYTHVISGELHDPVFRFTSWHQLRSPYGPLFTALTYPVALLPLPVAYWVLKVMTVLLSLGFIGLVAHCAKRLGRDPRFALLFVAANPIYLIYGVAGFHNDFFMLVPSTAAIAFLLSGRDRSAGAALMIAVAVKFTAILLLPFLLLAATPALRRRRVLVGAALATVPLVALSVALFGFSIPNLQDQSTLLTDFSIPNVLGDLLRVGGGTPLLLRIANVIVVLVVLFQLQRRREWLAGAGWATLALVASLAWLVPWYVIWVLPLAGLATSVWLRRASIALTVYLVFTFMPATGLFFSKHNINLLNTHAGQVSKTKQDKLAR